MNKILWNPNKEIMQSSSMMKLGKDFGFIKDNEILDYESLHNWSVNNLDDFWREVWKGNDVIGNFEEKAYKIAHDLRTINPEIIIDVQLAEGSLKSKLRKASKNNAKFAIIIGEEEIETNTIIIKPLIEKNSEQTVMDINEISSFFEDINSIGISPYSTDILMRDAMDKKRLALKILEIFCTLEAKA